MNKMKLIICLAAIFICAGTAPLLAEYNNSIALSGSYNSSYNGGVLDSNVGIGGSYRFWGIFNLNLNMYSDIVSGGENLFNIERIEPLGLFSLGWGARIPMGPGFAVIADLQRFYRGVGAEEEIFVFSDSWKVGINVELNEYCGLEFYTRRLFDFTDDARMEVDSLVQELPEDGVVDMMGVAFLFYL
ncbi:MAG: hypothetical protein JEY99_17185 [Spirochaetales bacterium]|nr:hypothetical protein [Spirochaetales bacterium]